jgi:hypothetical protein
MPLNEEGTNRANPRKREFVILLVVSILLVCIDLETVLAKIDAAVAKFYKLPNIPTAESLRGESRLGLIVAGAWLVLLLIALFRHRAKALWLLLGAPFVFLAISVAMNPASN